MDALKAAGNEAVRQGNYSAAIQHYNEAIALANAEEDDVSALHSNCSFAYLKLGLFTEALDEANKAVEKRNNWSKAHFRCGEAYFALCDYSNAEKAYEKALALSPEDGTVKKRLSLTREALEGFYFRQLFPGRDFCISPTDIIERQIFIHAEQMRNFVYLIGDAKTREAIVVDAAWDVKGIRAFAAAENIKLVGAVATHYHFDHTGGTPPPPFDALGIKVPGIFNLAVEDKIPVYANKHEVETIVKNNQVPKEAIRALEDSAVITVGAVKLHFIHTPGHTPGSQCIHIPLCGRLDLPDCDAKAMYTSLQKKLAKLPENTRVYPGHDYGGAYTSIADEKRTGLLRPINEKQWLRQHS